MKKLKNIYIVLFSMLMVFFGCQEDNYNFGEIVTPTNIVITAEIVGQDTSNPDLEYGDGSGTVNFTAVSENASSYVFYFDGVADKSPSGQLTKRFSKVGVNTYTVVVKANGTGGLSSTETLEVEVFSSFTDEEAENFLSGANIGDSKKWYWQADKDVHVGLGPVTDDYGNGEFAYEAWWNGIKAWDDEKSCMYDNEFVFTRTANGLTFEQTVGPAFVPGTYADVLGVAGDTCQDETVATSMFGVKNVSFGPSTSKAATEGSYNNEPYRGTSFEISEGGFMGWLVGSSTYDIISVTNDELIVRIIQDGDGFAWYHKFTSTKPVEGVVSYTYNNLVWEDDFNTDGTPDAANWTYDLGAGGWGNNELQTYTDNAENAKVEGGSLIITAKADGSGGYTSARLKSQGLRKFTYGRIEVNAKLPASQGTWPAIWMLGSNFPDVGWPKCGEIDIMEQTGSDKNTTLGTCHWFDEASQSKADYGTTTTVANVDSEFHLYTLEWTDASIKIYVDGVSFYELTNSSDLPFNADFFLILNIAMGGTLGGTVDAGFTEDTMEIDYVKVYQ
ncbi:glycoside hydrolase family 16 protein [Polaribacter vadi]|uniref:glycoside hydrolase family 16 protein n=1 Tax=Polaribacter TaxID=52959 RepID=UPI001C0A2B70|nr:MULTISPECIES: glycoside hydrolase family 16 protein [Polaribacter]MBU3010686.1 glycoside hydrolase family 16 protein [Polaribacter vadi]MDO6740497.1 glycoside hydrolase family 16 protein [Polaribacter sp. 1_MG-2023]